MKQLSTVNIYEISSDCYDMLLEEWGRVLQTRSEYYPHMLVVCQAHIDGLTRDSYELFSDELSYLSSFIQDNNCQIEAENSKSSFKIFARGQLSVDGFPFVTHSLVLLIRSTDD